MNEKELIGKVHSAVYHQCQRRGYAAPVDVLMEVGVLPKQKYEDWRFGRVDYLERVCTVNLRKLSFIMRQMRVCAQKSGLKSSFCYYKQWGVKKKNGQGHKPVVPLRFSKSGNPEIEKWYATYFVDTKRVAVLKAQQHIENPDFPKRKGQLSRSCPFLFGKGGTHYGNQTHHAAAHRQGPHREPSCQRHHMHRERLIHCGESQAPRKKLLQVAGRSG